MTCLEAIFSDEFGKQKDKIRDKATLDRLQKAVESILANPQKGKPLGRQLTGKKSVRVTPFRLIFEIKADCVVFHTFEHRKWAYR